MVLGGASLSLDPPTCPGSPCPPGRSTIPTCHRNSPAYPRTGRAGDLGRQPIPAANPPPRSASQSLQLTTIIMNQVHGSRLRGGRGDGVECGTQGCHGAESNVVTHRRHQQMPVRLGSGVIHGISVRVVADSDRDLRAVNDGCRVRPSGRRRGVRWSPAGVARDYPRRAAAAGPRSAGRA